MDVISTIIVFGFLEIQSNNVPVDDKLIKMYSKSNYQVTKLPRCILNQINKTYTCTCLGYEFCFQQHVTRQLYFFKPLSTYLRLNKNPGCLFFPFFFFIIGFLFSMGTVLMFTFRGDLQFSLSISLTVPYENLKVVSSQKGSVFQRWYISELYFKSLMEDKCFLMKKWRFYY